MRSKLHISGHPLHPMLIPLPIACAVISLISDIVGVAGGGAGWYFMGYVLTIGAWTTGLLAAIPGMTDYLFKIPNRTEAKKNAAVHMLLNVCMVGLYFVSWLIKNSHGGSVPAAGTSFAAPLILEIIGTGVLVAAGWFGWTLVYKHRVGVDEQLRESGSGVRKIA